VDAAGVARQHADGADRSASHPPAARLRGAQLPLHGARSAALQPGDARHAGGGGEHFRRHEPGARVRARRLSRRRRHEPALLAGQGVARRQPLRQGRGDRHGGYRGRRARPGSVHVSERLPCGGTGAERRQAVRAHRPGEARRRRRAVRAAAHGRGGTGRHRPVQGESVRRTARRAALARDVIEAAMDIPLSMTSGPVDTRRPDYQALKTRTHEELLGVLDLTRLRHVRREDAEPEIRTVLGGLLTRDSQGMPLSLYDRESLIGDILNELFGLGPLEALLRDPDVSDILVNRFDQVYVERHGRLEPTSITFKDDAHLLQIIERIVNGVGRRIDESSPMVDARLADGSRVNAIVPPLAIDGPALSIRRFPLDRLDAHDLIGRQTLTQPMLDFLQAAIACRLNIVVSGGTGAGKTTMLNVLSSFISERERIITIEDAAELVLRQRHVVRLETRPSNIEGKGAVKQRQLVINALRMRPDRIILGEVRGDETLDMLQAMNTGHDGSLTTIHANTPRDALYRLDTMVGKAT